MPAHSEPTNRLGGETLVYGIVRISRTVTEPSLLSNVHSILGLTELEWFGAFIPVVHVASDVSIRRWWLRTLSQALPLTGFDAREGMYQAWERGIYPLVPADHSVQNHDWSKGFRSPSTSGSSN